MTSIVKPAKMGPHDHVRIAMPIVAAATRTIDTMDSVFTFACETRGSLESTREVSALICSPSGMGEVHDFVE
jgi:hypothetical protein